MSAVTLKKACELTRKSKRTIQRYMSSGKLAYKTNINGFKEINIAELIRVFGELSPIDTVKVRPKDTPSNDTPTDERLNKLIALVESQQNQIASLTKSIDELTGQMKNNLLAAPVTQQPEVVENIRTTKSKSEKKKVVSDYLDMDNISFL